MTLAEALRTGQTLRTYSETAGLSLHTARNQLKGVFHKTDTHRQSELVRLLLVGARRISNP